MEKRAERGPICSAFGPKWHPYYSHNVYYVKYWKAKKSGISAFQVQFSTVLSVIYGPLLTHSRKFSRSRHLPASRIEPKKTTKVDFARKSASTPKKPLKSFWIKKTSRCENIRPNHSWPKKSVRHHQSRFLAERPVAAPKNTTEVDFRAKSHFCTSRRPKTSPHAQKVTDQGKFTD